MITFTRICIFLILGLVTSCNTKSDTRLTLRDSVVQNYIALVDTSGQYDTTELGHQVLKAYLRNDTTFFKELQQTTLQNRERENWNLWNADIPLPKLQELDIDEGYRFILSILNQSYYKAVTLTKNRDSVSFHFAFFSKPFGAKKPKVNWEHEKKLTMDEWETVIDKLQDGDFWQLRNETSRGRDASDITIIGYRRESEDGHVPSRYQFVHRYSPSTLNDVSLYVFEHLLDEKYRDW